MNIIKHLIKKIKLQFHEMKNGGEYLYTKCFRYNKKMPDWITRIIAKMNTGETLKLYEYKPLFLPTYDGSKQAVHPDILYWRDEFWLICTPYPYGIDTYENPCIYHSKNIYQWHVPDGCFNPLAYPSIQKKGYHLSDPCLVVFQNKLLVYYRETHKKEGIDKSYINMISSTDGSNWQNPVTVMKSDTDTLISPAILSSKERCLMFHVRLDNPYGGTILLSRSDDGIKWVHEGEVQVENIPEGMIIWHISIMTNNGYGKTITENNDSCDDLLGLFLLRGLNTSNVYKLYWASTQGNALHWRINEELRIPAELKKWIDLFYKSAVVPETGDLLISGRDYKKHRWYLYLMPKKEIYCGRKNENDAI